MNGAVLWAAAQATSVLVAVTAVGLLLFAPRLGLFVTWKVLVPAVPALLLVAPQVWRNLCPIAVVHQLPARLGRASSRRLSPSASRYAPAVAALLLFAIVPLRLVIFNESGPALAFFVVAVLAVALIGGIAYLGKAGWCATWCPVLPVERLYGQKPIVPAPHAHCTTCSGCLKSCYDLKPGGSMPSLLGRSPRRSRADGLASPLRSPTGLFAAGFPGFVLGYFTMPAALPLPGIYLRLAIFVAAAILVLAGFAWLADLGTAALVRASAALAAALYYWFTVPDVAGAAHELIGIDAAPALGIALARAAFLLLATAWLVLAARASLREPTT